jgi:hypothetical protein
MKNKIIEHTIKLLTPEKAWIKGTAAKTARGKHVAAVDSKAVSFCLIGALTRAAHELRVSPGDHTYLEVVMAVRKQLVVRGVWQAMIAFNDHPKTTKAHVMTALKGALK